MLEALAIKAALGKVWEFLKIVPREIWYALAVFAAWWVLSSHYIGVGEDRILDQLRQAEADAEKKAAIARAEADEKSEERAKEFEQEQEILKEKIDEAERTGGNALDSIFSD
jgi:hypothetical protein